VFETCEDALRLASPILPLFTHDCGNSPERGATFPSLASRTWPILNLGLRFSNKMWCSVQPA
jgi:hypothetical protein